MGSSQTSKGSQARGREREGLNLYPDILLYFFSHSSNQLRFFTAPHALFTCMASILGDSPSHPCLFKSWHPLMTHIFFLGTCPDTLDYIITKSKDSPLLPVCPFLNAPSQRYFCASPTDRVCAHKLLAQAVPFTLVTDSSSLNSSDYGPSLGAQDSRCLSRRHKCFYPCNQS